jgi:glycosyltransferase involved in cell wall biosynthesis
VDERVLLLEPVHPLQLARLTPEADVGIAAYCDVSRNNTLCAPNKLSEYAIAGIPIVGTDQRPICDFVEKHGNGVVYRAGDVRGCASALRHALVDEPSVAHLRDHARTAAAHVSWEPERARLAAILRSALVPRHTAELPSL